MESFNRASQADYSRLGSCVGIVLFDSFNRVGVKPYYASQQQTV